VWNIYIFTLLKYPIKIIGVGVVIFIVFK
jgi:hypothetical protein